MISLMFLAAVVGWVVVQVLICRRWGLPALAAVTAVSLGGINYLWLRTAANFPENACEACRLAGKTCGGCEALGYTAVLLGFAGAFFVLTGLIVGAIHSMRRRGK